MFALAAAKIKKEKKSERLTLIKSSFRHGFVGQTILDLYVCRHDLEEQHSRGLREPELWFGLFGWREGVLQEQHHKRFGTEDGIDDFAHVSRYLDWE